MEADDIKFAQDYVHYVVCSPVSLFLKLYFPTKAYLCCCCTMASGGLPILRMIQNCSTCKIHVLCHPPVVAVTG